MSALILTMMLHATTTSMNAGSLANALDRLAGTGRVLYVAAHPDDENTRLLAYLANGRHMTAAYLSMTRGGGGQNLIGREQDELLDVIRTQELLAARSLDGAVQRFTRMRDFGYSKSAPETLAFWDHDQALYDVVWVIRSFQPDVIITRFDENPPNHGHHTASAILAREAFAAAADPKMFPEQLKLGVSVWKADRLLHNVPQWREGPPPKDAIPLDVGAYDVRLGVSYGELAAVSRSQHKSQGFGVPGERGPLIERFLPIAGTRPTKEIFEGLDLGWSRFGPKAAPLAKALDQAVLQRDTPEKVLPALLEAHRAFDALPDEPRVRAGKQALEEVIAAASGLFVRVTAEKPAVVPGGTIALRAEVVMRRPAGLTLKKVTFAPGVEAMTNAALALNEKKDITQTITVPAEAAVSAPYWLARPSLAGRQEVTDPRLIGEPDEPAALNVSLELSAGGRVFTLETPVVFSWTDRVHGERIRRFYVAPPATVTPVREAVMFPNGRTTRVELRVRSAQDNLQGEVSLGLSGGWSSEPAVQPVQIARAGDEILISFEVAPGKDPLSIAPRFEAAGRTWSYREDTIDYPHLPLQVVLQPAALRLVPLSLRTPKGLIGYIQGSGDTIAEDLAHAGARLEVLDEETIRGSELSRFSAIILGIRAFNTRSILRTVHPRLMRYVEQGGTVVVQYNTNSRWDVLDQQIGPFPLEIGRDRITDENAELIAVDPKHPILNTPNKISAADFQGWVQERGLYFAAKWDPKYSPIFRGADPGEQPLLGATLAAKHGRGRFVYTGLAFFRQLPAGVPGAYRLFMNLLGGSAK